MSLRYSCNHYNNDLKGSFGDNVYCENCDVTFENFVELNNAGICCFLFDALHNRKYQVGYKRIKSLNELV